MRTDPVQSEPVGLYQGPRLAAFQGWSLIGVLAGAVSIGVLLHVAANGVRDRWRQAHQFDVSVNVVSPAAEQPDPRARVQWPMALPGPDGTTVTLSGTAIVNVWLQGCPDCMPAFEAMKQLQSREAFEGARVFNVAYGSAAVDWARQYGVEGNLAFDEGSHFVQALGISTFTTLVVDDDGFVRSQGSPVAQDFVPRVWSVFREMQRPAVASVSDVPRVNEIVAFLRGHEHELRECSDTLDAQTTVRVQVSATAEGTLQATANTANGHGLATALTGSCLVKGINRWSVGTVAPAPTDVTVDVTFTPRAAGASG